MQRNESTAAEKLAMEIVELREDVDELQRRLDGRPPYSLEYMRHERAQRWKQVLAIVEAALGERGRG
jgi:hypothetical protein